MYEYATHRVPYEAERYSDQSPRGDLGVNRVFPRRESHRKRNLRDDGLRLAQRVGFR